MFSQTLFLKGTKTKMLKAQNNGKENAPMRMKSMVTMNAPDVATEEQEEGESKHHPSSESTELSGWFLKKGELLNRWNERYVSVDEKNRTLSFYASLSPSSPKATSIVTFDALEKFSVVSTTSSSSSSSLSKRREDEKAIRVQLRNGKDLFLKRNDQQQKQKNNSSFLFEEGGEEEWCAKMNTILNLLPTPECRQKRGGINNNTLNALKNSSSGKSGIGKIVLGNANVTHDNHHHDESIDNANNERSGNTPPSATRRHIKYHDNDEVDEASSTVSSSYYGTSAIKNGGGRSIASTTENGGDSQNTNERVLDTFKAMELALRAKDELLSAQIQLTDRLETQLKEKELEIQRLTRKLNGTKDLQEAFDEANMRAMEMEDQAAMLSVSIDSLTRELDDVRAQKAVVQNALLRESAFMQEREYEMNKKLSDATLKLQKIENEKKHQKYVYETTERELTLSRDRLLAEIARERRNRGMFSPEQQHQKQRAMKQRPRGGASSLALGNNNNNNTEEQSRNNTLDQPDNTKEESPIRQISFVSHTPLNQSIASRDDDNEEVEEGENGFYRRADKNLSKLLTPEEHSCRVQ